jgi:hypothetical protein
MGRRIEAGICFVTSWVADDVRRLYGELTVPSLQFPVATTWKEELGV